MNQIAEKGYLLGNPYSAGRILIQSDRLKHFATLSQHCLLQGVSS
jgi:hypothetical protein